MVNCVCPDIAFRASFGFEEAFNFSELCELVLQTCQSLESVLCSLAVAANCGCKYYGQMHKLSRALRQQKVARRGSGERRRGPEGAAGLFSPCHLADDPGEELGIFWRDF